MKNLQALHRKLMIALLAVTTSYTSLAQVAPPEITDMIHKFQTRESAYVCNAAAVSKEVKGSTPPANAVSSGTFDSLFIPIVSKVIVNNEDLVKNGNAASLSFSDATKKLSINYSWQKKNSSWFHNVGINAEGASDNFFELYNKNGWQHGIGATYGVTIPLKTRSIFFLPSNCQELLEKRRLHFKGLIGKYHKALMIDQKVLHTRLEKYRAGIDLINDNADKIHQDVLSTFSTEAEFKQAVSDSALLKSLLTSSQTRDDLLTTDIVDFEKKNFSGFGYSVRWVNMGAGFNLKTFNIFDTAVRRLAEVKKQDTYRWKLFGNFNYMKVSAHKWLFYYSAGITIGNMNMLEELLPDDIETLKNEDPQSSTVVTKEFQAIVVKDYDQLKKNYIYINPGFTANYFFAPKRIIGLELRADTKLKAFVRDDVNARHTFTIKGGLLFSFNGEEQLTKTTFGLIASFNDIPYNDLSAKDRFIFGLRIGVPFNLK